MLDIRFMLENTDLVRDSIRRRGVNSNIDNVLKIYSERKQLKTNLDGMRAESNIIATQIPTLSNEQKQNFIKKGRSLNQEITTLEEQLRVLDVEFNDAMLGIPNMLADDTPFGSNDSENVVLRKHLTPRTFDFMPKNHVEIGESLNLIDFDSGAKVAGSKFYFLKNEGVLLEMALQLFALQVAIKHGYIPLATPDLAKKSILNGTGFSPRGEESNIYNIQDLDLSLIATAEIPVGGLHSDEIIDEDRLPLKYVATSHCFRREAGSAGKESKGLYRVHQFTKVELFQITKPEDAENALEEILKLEETIYSLLELPYRVVRICDGDLGAAAYKKYDIEVWMPGRDSDEKYGEVTSASNCTDFQSRRLNIKYRTKDNKKIYPYTLNGTAIALSRTLLAIIENYQQKDGSVIIPEALRSYIGLDIIKKR